MTENFCSISSYGLKQMLQYFDFQVKFFKNIHFLQEMFNYHMDTVELSLGKVINSQDITTEINLLYLYLSVSLQTYCLTYLISICILALVYILNISYKVYILLGKMLTWISQYHNIGHIL